MTRPAVFMRPTITAVQLRQARMEDLAVLNGVVERAAAAYGEDVPLGVG